MINRTRKFFRKIYNRIRFGHVQLVVNCTSAGVVSEVMYIDSKGEIVGYWAYGHFDPSFPYRE